MHPDDKLLENARNMTSTDADLIAKARALCDAATPGPWYLEDMGFNRIVLQSRTNNGRGYKPIAHIRYEFANNNQNADFIAESRELLPRLIDLAEKRGAMLVEVAQFQSDAVDRFRKEGTVFHKSPFSNPKATEAEKWEDTAFGLYTNLCQIDSMIRNSDEFDLSEWRRIGPDDVVAIKRAIRSMDDPNFHLSTEKRKSIDLLRRLISEEKE